MLIVFVFVQTFEKKIRTYVNSLGWKTSLGIEEKIVYRYSKTREDDNNVCGTPLVHFVDVNETSVPIQ